MHKKKILVIDDEPDIITTLKHLLERRGYEVVVAYDGEAGLKKVSEDNPDLVILDLKLPKLIGEEVCRQIKKDAKTAGIPVIMITGRKLDADRIICRLIGANSYMTKPFEMAELLTKIDYYLKQPDPTGRAI